MSKVRTILAFLHRQRLMTKNGERRIEVIRLKQSTIVCWMKERYWGHSATSNVKQDTTRCQCAGFIICFGCLTLETRLKEMEGNGTIGYCNFPPLFKWTSQRFYHSWIDNFKSRLILLFILSIRHEGHFTNRQKDEDDHHWEHRRPNVDCADQTRKDAAYISHHSTNHISSSFSLYSLTRAPFITV